MTTITIEVPDALLAKVAQQERSVQEIVVDLLEDAFENGQNAVAALEPTREEMIHQLVQAGLIREPGTFDSPAAKAWRDLSQAEKHQHLNERNALRFEGSPGAAAIIEGRR